jgi:hypothetical protein
MDDAEAGDRTLLFNLAILAAQWGPRERSAMFRSVPAAFRHVRDVAEFWMRMVEQARQDLNVDRSQSAQVEAVAQRGYALRRQAVRLLERLTEFPIPEADRSTLRFVLMTSQLALGLALTGSGRGWPSTVETIVEDAGVNPLIRGIAAAQAQRAFAELPMLRAAWERAAHRTAHLWVQQAMPRLRFASWPRHQTFSTWVAEVLVVAQWEAFGFAVDAADEALLQRRDRALAFLERAALPGSWQSLVGVIGKELQAIEPGTPLESLIQRIRDALSARPSAGTRQTPSPDVRSRTLAVAA